MWAVSNTRQSNDQLNLYINTESLFVVAKFLEICTYCTTTFYTKPIPIDVTILFATLRTVYTYLHKYPFDLCMLLNISHGAEVL